MTTPQGRALEPGPLWLVRAGLLVLAVAAAIGTPADADLWGHLRFGQDILQTGSVIQADRFSFTADRPWINHEWLAEVIFALTYAGGGATGLILLKLGVITALLAVVWGHLRRIVASPAVMSCLLAFVFVGTYWRMHNVRPQIFSVFLFAVALAILWRADAGRRRSLLLLPVLMALWVNLHGGWIVGLAVLGFWFAARMFDGRRPLAQRGRLAAVGLATALATLANPYGTGLWRFLAETVRFTRADIVDWGSIVAHPVLVGIPWAITCAIALLAIVRGGWSRVDYLLIVLVAAVASARVSRLDAFFALAVVTLLAPEVARAWPPRGLATVRAAGPAPEPQWKRTAITVLAMMAMVVPAAWVVRPYLGCVTVGGAWAPDAEAARFIAVNQLKGHMITWFDWGEYAIWHFGPDVQVSMDGRRETVYSEELIQAHRRFYAADPSAIPFLDALNPDYIWVPAHLPVTPTLPEHGWVPIFTGPISSIYAPPDQGPFDGLSPAAASPRCFPGP